MRHAPSTGQGASRHGEEELFPQCVGDPREAQPWHGSIETGPRVAGCVQRQADVGSGAQGLLVCTQGPAQSCFRKGPTLGLAAVSGDPTRKGEGCQGPQCAYRPQGHLARRRGPAGRSCPQPQRLSLPSNPGPSKLPSRATILGMPSMNWCPPWPHCVYPEAGYQPRVGNKPTKT